MLTAAGKMLKSMLCWNLFTVIENKEHTHKVPGLSAVPLCDITRGDFQNFRAGSQAVFSRLLLQRNQEALHYSVIDSSPTLLTGQLVFSIFADCIDMPERRYCQETLHKFNLWTPQDLLSPQICACIRRAC